MVTVLFGLTPLRAQIGSDQDFQCFPTCSEVDSRMLSLGGTALNTVAGFEIAVAIVAGSDASSFEIGIFDGDTGKDAFGVVSGNPALGTWDQGTDELIYTLLADPDGDGTGTFMVAQWMGNSVNTPSGLWTSTQTQMPDNDWFNAVISTSEEARNSVGQPFRYRLRIMNPAPTLEVSSSFKLRVTAGMTVRSSDSAWGVQASVRSSSGPTARIIYPQWDGSFTLPTPDFFLTTPTTYDGTFSFLFEVEPNSTEVRIFDGDFDHGALRLPDPGGDPELDDFLPGVPSGAAIERCFETDDPNFSGVPPFAPLANPEGAVNLPIPPNLVAGGNPPDDSEFDIFRRTPCVVIDVVDPNGTVYRDLNPSGNFEWEEIVITSLAADSSSADYSTTYAADGATLVSPGFLPAGTWKLVLRGLDVGNTVFLNGPAVAGVASAAIGDRVWLDRDEDGVQDDPSIEPGINGVTVRLYLDDGDGIFNPNPNPGTSFGFDTLAREETTSGDGDYLFEGLGAGGYFVQAAPESFAPGSPNPGPLYGAAQTFDFDGTLDNLTFVSIQESDRFLLADFGYKFGSIGDLVWLDGNANGVFEPLAGEIGISGVELNFSGDLNGDGPPESLDQLSQSDGFYTFNENPTNLFCSDCGIPEGLYEITVPAANFNAGGPLFGLVQTFDFDGVLDNRTDRDLAAGEDFVQADFGYRPLSSPGAGTPGYWKNHPWPVGEITVGGVVYTRDEAIPFLKNRDRDEGDQTFTLFAHLVAAKLNVAVGNDWSCIDPEILQADEWMSLYPLGSGVDADSAPWQQPTNGLPPGEQLKNVLDRYNNGELSCAEAHE